MMSVRMICVGKLREPFYRDAFAEYSKRLGGYCRFECTELQEVRLPDQPSAREIAAALDKEADLVVNRRSVLSSAPPTAFPIRSNAVRIFAFPCRI